MSLARTALRLSVITALRADPVIAAMCGDRIFDSLIEEFEAETLVPTIVVLTESDGGAAFSPQNGGPPFDQTCELSLEIAMRQIVSGDDEQPAISIPNTDRELEAGLDLIEEAAINAVTIADTPQSRLVRQAVTRRVTKFQSTRFAADGTGVKYAIRELRLTVELKGETVSNPLDVPTGHFALLPDPLRTVAYAMPAGSSELQTCEMILASMSGTPPQQFTGATVTYAPKPPAYPAVPPVPITTDPNVPVRFGDTITILTEAPDGP